MSTQTPCQLGDSEDWFIEKDGKQYRDDEILDAATLADIRHSVPDDLPFEDFEAEYERLVDVAERNVLTAAQIRRRKARDACYDCPVRLACLDARLETNVEYGTWGGYYPEELRQIEEVRDERRSRQSSGVH